jgi:hypothetical protein
MVTGSDPAVERMPGRDFADHREPRRHARDVVRARGVSVHGGHVVRRLRAPGGEIGGKNAAVRVIQSRGFGGERRCALQHPTERLCNRHQRCHKRHSFAR